MIYLDRLGCTGLYLGTTKTRDPWWLLPESARNPRGNTLDLLLATHFPYSIVAEVALVPAAACRVTCVDWRVAAGIITYSRVGWAISSFATISKWAQHTFELWCTGLGLSGFLHSPERGNVQVSSSHVCMGRPCNVPSRSST